MKKGNILFIKTQSLFIGNVLKYTKNAIVI